MKKNLVFIIYSFTTLFVETCHGASLLNCCRPTKRLTTILWTASVSWVQR